MDLNLSLIAVVVIVVYLLSSIKILAEYERGVILRLGRVRANDPQFAKSASSFEEARTMVRRVEQARRALELYRLSRPRDSTVDFTRRVIPALEPDD